MRVSYLCQDLGIPPDGNKGAAAHVRGFLRAAHALEHEVVLLTPHPVGTVSVGKGVEIPVHPIPRPRLNRAVLRGPEARLWRALGHLWTNVPVDQALEEHIRFHRPDLVYERYSPFGVAGSLTSRRLGVRHVLEVNAPLAWEGIRYRGQALAEAATALEREAFANAGSIVAVSDELKAMLIAEGVPQSKIDVVPNGVDGHIFGPSCGPRVPPSPDRVTIGFVGSLKPWHGLAHLLEAFDLMADDARLHLLVIGDGPEAHRVEALAEQMPDRITWTGAIPQEEVARHLRQVDIAVAPYPPLERFFYSPLKVLEYMASGCAVAASGIGQLRGLIEDDVTGVLTPPGDPRRLARVILELAGDPERRTRLGQAAEREVLRVHLWEHRVGRALAAPARAA